MRLLRDTNRTTALESIYILYETTFDTLPTTLPTAKMSCNRCTMHCLPLLIHYWQSGSMCQRSVFALPRRNAWYWHVIIFNILISIALSSLPLVSNSCLYLRFHSCRTAFTSRLNTFPVIIHTMKLTNTITLGLFTLASVEALAVPTLHVRTTVSVFFLLRPYWGISTVLA
jgi:hypothetical protein